MVRTTIKVATASNSNPRVDTKADTRSPNKAMAMRNMIRKINSKVTGSSTGNSLSMDNSMDSSLSMVSRVHPRPVVSNSKFGFNDNFQRLS